MTQTLNMETRLSNQISNFQDRNALPAGYKIVVNDLVLKWKNARHRPVGPCATYNCHGLTFASRRTQITSAQEVAYILEDDEYARVPLAQVMPGDVAVYYIKGDAEHSGIVVERDQFSPWILSKWGPAHEAIHRPAECEYDASDVRYFRIAK